MSTPPDLRSGTHLVFDDPGADRLLELGATNVVRAAAQLGVGPSRLDALEHARAREAWFDGPDTWDHLAIGAAALETPVVVWATPCLHDRLNLWRTVSWLRHRGIPPREVFIVDLPSRPWGPRAPSRQEPFECGDSVFYHSDEALQAQLAATRPWPRRRHDQAVGLWEQYVQPDPRGFVGSCVRGVDGFPELGSTWAFLRRFFPRMDAGRALRLSQYDEILFCALSTDWQTPLQVYTGAATPERWEFLSCVGDLTVVRRLASWASHDAGSAVERACGPSGPDRPMLSHLYRLTEQGVRLRAELAQLADAPRLPVAGTEAYASEAPWVLLDDGTLGTRT